MSNSPEFTTPVGIAVYPHLNRPDTKFHDLGAYKCNILVPIEEAKPLMDKLVAFYKQSTGQAPNKFENYMFKLSVDEDGEPTGMVEFKIAVKNRMTKKGELWDRKPKMFGADLLPCPNANPYGGSKLRVSMEAYAWDAGGKKGVSLQPKAVQIIELVSASSGGAGAGAFGFSKEEGYTAEADAAAFVETPMTDDAPASDDEGDF